MKNLQCNHCGKEVSAENLHRFLPRYKNFVTAERLIAEKPRTAPEIQKLLGVTIRRARHICDIVAEKVNIAEEGTAPRYIYKPRY